MTALYGDIPPARTLVIAAVRDHLKLWLPGYLGEIERQTDRTPAGRLPPVRGWKSRSEFDQWLGEAPPAGMIVCPQTLDTGHANNRRVWATFDVRIGVTVATGGQTAASADAVEALADAYGAAVRAAILQHPTLGDRVHRTEWTGESYEEIPGRKSGTLGVAMNRFSITARDLLDPLAGPVEPPEDPSEPPEDPPLPPTTANIVVDHLED